MQFNLLKSLNNNHLICLFTSTFLCFITPMINAQENTPKNAYQLEKTDLKSLTLLQSDFKDEYLNGFIWQPFILPLENLTITNASLFVGQHTKDDNAQISTFDLPPKEGECILLRVKTVETNQKKSLYKFLNTTQQKRINTSLFFILDNMHQPIAVGRLNAKGESKCMLSSQSYIVSIGYGRQRRDISVNPKTKTVALNFPAVGALRVNPDRTTNILNGDIIRIGRKINFDFSRANTQFKRLLISAKIHSDLYENADMISHDLAVDEYMKTSFLVGESRYQIELEPGNYVVAVLRKNKLLCIKGFTLLADGTRDLSCATSALKKSPEEIAYEFDSTQTIFDVGFRPQNLIRNKNFVNWVVSTPGTILLGPPVVHETQASIDLNEDNFFSLIFKTNNTIFQTSYGASFSESINDFKIPLVGMSKHNMLTGQTPFSEYIYASNQKYTTPYFLNLSHVTHTNGAQISILEPIMTNNGNLFGTNGQDFLVRIMVPRWNSTNILEMFVNGQMVKRWILQRGEVSKTFSTTEKVNTYEDKNFMVKFVTRGESPLPNFLTGKNSFLPFAETREFCVSLDGKDNCL